MKIIITGGTGFLGNRLLKKLIFLNHDVFNYDIIDGYDILDINKLDEVFKSFRPEVIIHLAACADLNIFRENPEISQKINVAGTKNILDKCEQYKCRLLFASTCCSYGNNDTHPSDETSPVKPTEPYAQSKVDSEKDILKIGLPHCCMRLATFYGPEMRKELAPAIFIDKIHNDQIINIHGSGEQTRTLTYVDDIISGIITIMNNEPKYKIINITTEEIISVNDMIDVISNILKKEVKSKNIEDRPGQIYKEMILSSRLQELGWKPQTLFEEGITKSYEYYISNNNKW